MIRGYSMMEDAVVQAIDRALGGKPDELRRISGPPRLALARGLGLIDNRLEIAIECLRRLRNQFAHTLNDTLNGQRYDESRVASDPFIPVEIGIQGYDQISQLRTAIGMTWAELKATIFVAEQERANAERDLRKRASEGGFR